MLYLCRKLVKSNYLYTMIIEKSKIRKVKTQLDWGEMAKLAVHLGVSYQTIWRWFNRPTNLGYAIPRLKWEKIQSYIKNR